MLFGIMKFDLSQIVIEDLLPVAFFKQVIKLDAELLFPGLEFCEFWLLSRSKVKAEKGQNSDDDREELGVHL